MLLLFVVVINVIHTTHAHKIIHKFCVLIFANFFMHLSFSAHIYFCFFVVLTASLSFFVLFLFACFVLLSPLACCFLAHSIHYNSLINIRSPSLRLTLFSTFVFFHNLHLALYFADTSRLRANCKIDTGILLEFCLNKLMFIFLCCCFLYDTAVVLIFSSAEKWLRK